MICLRNISADTLHKGDTEDDDDDNDDNDDDNNNNNNNNNPYSVDPLYVPRKQGGRGLMQLEAAHAVETTKLVAYVERKTH